MLTINPELKKKIILSDSSIQIFLSLISKEMQKIVFIEKNYEDSINLKNRIKLFDSNVEVLVFPEFDCSFFLNISPTKDVLYERIKTLNNLISSKKGRVILICPIKALISKTIPIDKFKKKKLIVNNYSKNIYQNIKTFLTENNYEFVDIVRNIGEYSVRGQIIDVFSPAEENPLRILFNLDDIEYMNYFDRHSQNNLNKIDKYVLLAATEIIFDNESIRTFRELFRKYRFKDKEEFYKSISNKILIPGSEQFFPIIYKNHSPVLDYLKNFSFFVKEDLLEEYDNYFKDLSYNFDNQKIKNEEINNFLLKKEVLYSQLKGNIFLFKNFADEKNELFFSENIVLKKNKIENLSNVKKLLLTSNFDKIFFCYDSILSKKKIINTFNQHEIKFHNTKKLNDKKKIISLTKLSIDSSFCINLSKRKIAFFSDKDFFDKIIKKKITKNVTSDNIINEFNQLTIGDLIVHVDHGVGKFSGLKKKNINSIEQEFIEISYFNNDKLLIPVSNLELISKYGFSDNKVQLDRLGLSNWQQKKASLKKKIKEIAEDLIKTAAKRKLRDSIKLTPNSLEYEKFSSAFEFTETSDQVKVIQQIENDFQSSKPMDRLICGDVGFGKTEIAMRAAFYTLSAGYQVAMICPKVLLVNQHYETFISRFNGFNYNINKISRFQTAKEKKNIKEKLNLGLIDLIIGTHAILSSDVSFKKLGLIIIDEEQSFGVEQKEQLKKIQPNSNILTLSATPIPRTLQSSLLNLRDISFIKTPPVNRLNIKTYLMVCQDNLLKKIILDELNRGGQIFYVTPRIEDISFIEKKLKNLFNNLKYSVIHSRLKNNEIDKIYNDFFNKKTDLLLSTAMIESGLDVSNVNTIIINKPYLFGLSQLYQLRGRVGRSSIQAYAYLMLEKNTSLSDDKLYKLKLISKIDKLGAGFSIAANDLDMRGSGNIIGSEQSGHIKEVGIELYFKMLNECIKDLKNEKKPNIDWSPVLNLGFSFNIPENYIVNLDIRMQIYRKISEINEILDRKDIVKNLEDRFGKFPDLFENLFKLIEIKILCKKLNIKKIEKAKNGFAIELRNEKVKYTDKLIELAKLNFDKIKLLPNSKLMYISKIENNDLDLKQLKIFLEMLLEYV